MNNNDDNGQYNQNGYTDMNGQYNQNGYTDANGQYNQNGYTDSNGQYNQNGYSGMNGQYYDPNSAYNNGQYYNPYGGQNGSGYTGGPAPLGKDGQPLKNRFGMKLTFSILEIICGNIISLVCGIIGCVFTAKQNTAYREGRWEDFKAAAKSATIALWVGFAGFILTIILAIIVVAMVGFTTIATIIGLAGNPTYYGYGTDDGYYYDYSYEEDDDSDDYFYDDAEDSEDEGDYDESYVTDYLPEVEGKGYTEAAFDYAGHTITLPTTIAELESCGFHLYEDEQEEILEAKDYNFFSMENEGDCYFMIYAVNPKAEKISIRDSVVCGIYLTSYTRGDGSAEEFSMYDGAITFTTSQDEILQFMGTPDYSYKSEDEYGVYESWEWYGPGDDSGYYKNLTITFSDGEIGDVDIVWEE